MPFSCLTLSGGCSRGDPQQTLAGLCHPPLQCHHWCLGVLCDTLACDTLACQPAHLLRGNQPHSGRDLTTTIRDPFPSAPALSLLARAVLGGASWPPLASCQLLTTQAPGTNVAPHEHRRSCCLTLSSPSTASPCPLPRLPHPVLSLASLPLPGPMFHPQTRPFALATLLSPAQ